MRRIALAVTVLVLAFTVGASARAQTPPVTTFVFVAVDSVDLEDNDLRVTGILQGEAAQTTRTFNVPNLGSPYVAEGIGISLAQSCERKALLAMSKPGQYILEVRQPIYYKLGCRLTRVTP